MNKIMDMEISGQEGLLKANELSNFLYYFRAIYAIAVDKFSNIPAEEIIASKEYYYSEMQRAIAEAKSTNEVWELCFNDLDGYELLISEISQNSPFKIKTTGLIAALVLAVIISGGEVDLVHGKFKLNPLGEGISAMKKAIYAEPEQSLDNSFTP